MKETDIKYLAGLLDADGSFFFNYSKNRVYLTVSLDLTDGIDREFKYTKWLAEQLDVSPHYFVRESNAAGVTGAKLTISRRSTLEKLVPRLLKYLVIKGRHLQRLYDVSKALKGLELKEDEINKLKQFVKTSRQDVGPIRHKEWLPKAYVAGYLDGDGCYLMKKSSGTYNVSAVAHEQDRIIIDLLHKQYGGKVYRQKDWVRWRRPLGRSNKSFAVPFLRDMHKHSRLKFYKIEQFLHHHSQRLTEESSTEEVIV